MWYTLVEFGSRTDQGIGCAAQPPFVLMHLYFYGLMAVGLVATQRKTSGMAIHGAGNPVFCDGRRRIWAKSKSVEDGVRASA